MVSKRRVIRDALLVACLLAGWYILRREKLTRYQIAYRDGYLQSDHWQEVRKRKLKQAGYKCEACGEKVKLDIHHLTYERLGKERLDDLQALCRDCHVKAEKRKR